METLNKQARRHLPLSLIAAALIILIAAGAIFYLCALAALYEKASRSSAAKSVIDQGAYISQWLADHPFFQGTQAFYRDGTLKITVPKKPASNSLARKVTIM